MSKLSKSHERWAEIPGYPLIEISDRGRVRTWRSHPNSKSPVRQVPKIKKPSINPVSGYLMVFLYGGTYRQGLKNFECRYVHRLVAEAFVPGDKTLIVAHLDGSRDNNRYTNLAWVTQKENMEHAREHGTLRLGDAHDKVTKVCDRAIYAMRLLAKTGMSYAELGALFGGLTPQYISRIITQFSRKGVTLEAKLNESIIRKS